MAIDWVSGLAFAMLDWRRVLQWVALWASRREVLMVGMWGDALELQKGLLWGALWVLGKAAEMEVAKVSALGSRRVASLATMLVLQ